MTTSYPPSAARINAWWGSISRSTEWDLLSAPFSRSDELERSSTSRILAPRPLSEAATARGSDMPSWREARARLRSSSTMDFSRTRLRTRANSAVSSSGLVKKSSAPESSPFSLSLGWSSAVTITTGMCAVVGEVFSLRHTSKPSMPGIITSRRTMSASPASQMRRASGPFMAVMTSKYSAESLASSSRTLGRMSSTTRTRADMDLLPHSIPGIGADSFKKLCDRDGL
jgi:hypothetical protein